MYVPNVSLIHTLPTTGIIVFGFISTKPERGFL